MKKNLSLWINITIAYAKTNMWVPIGLKIVFLACFFLVFNLVSLFAHSFSLDSDAPKKFVIVIPSFNNIQWYRTNLESALAQNHPHFRIIYLDDASTDGTGSAVEQLLIEQSVPYRSLLFKEIEGESIPERTARFAEELKPDPLQERPFFLLVRNEKRCGALENLYRAILSCDDDEIIAALDGDDWLFPKKQVLQKLSEVYSSGEVWYTHGCLMEYPWGNVTWSEPIPDKIIAQNRFREFKCPSHLRTFYSWLFKKIQLEDLLWKGKFFPMAWDMAIEFPMAEMAKWRGRYIDEPIYVYNMANTQNDNKVDPALQNQLDAYIRAKAPYSPLKSDKSAFSFNKVVVWGHKLHSHTHSYIHHGFVKAFSHLGYPTYWLDEHDFVPEFDFSHTLFLTEGQADREIPIREDCFYLLHNCTDSKYASLPKEKQVKFQVYTDDILQYQNILKIAPGCYYHIPDRCVYMPWATDLLPHEINLIKKELPFRKIERHIYWVGTIGDGEYGNKEEISPFIHACHENQIPFIQCVNVDPEEQLEKIASSWLAPAIVGTWQKERGYIPCRIFKNISYGKMGVTNSFRAYELFNKKIVYNSDSYQLFYDAQKKLQTLSQRELIDLMDQVRDKHTYLNRVELLLRFFHLLHLIQE